MVRVGRQERRSNKTYKGIGIFHSAGVLSIEAIDGNLTIVNITERHKTRVAFGITKGGTMKHFSNISGSATHKCLTGLLVPVEQDDMFAVLKATIEDVAALMDLPVTISDVSLLQAIKTSVSTGAASLTASGVLLKISPTNYLLEAKQWITTQVPAAQYKNCNLSL